MSIRSQAYADFKDILDTDNDAVTLIAPDATEYDVKGQVTRRDAQIDPQLGVQIQAPMLTVTVSINGLATIPTTAWTVSTTDVTGAALTYRVADVRVDRTIGFVNLILEDYGG